MRTVACVGALLNDIIIRVYLYANSSLMGPAVRLASLLACMNDMYAESMEILASAREDCLILRNARINASIVLRNIIAITVNYTRLRATILR